MLDRFKKALPYSLSFSITLTLMGIPRGHYHVEHMVSEILQYFVLSFIVCIVVNVLCTWLLEKGQRKKQ